ncbi:MAG: bifunctional glutamate N-acetyltransferase/amino-acid acetyltransferase ArgJ [Nitrospiraceae bacterium]|nr:bifunctional glutamate N-acetyltransferase/amino-acid acetyltransferase ArgJ [Nitrospiraceae bacterium]
MKIPRGFLFSTAGAGIKKPGRQDLALISSVETAVCAGMFTRNKIKGAPVKLDIERIRSGKARAIIANSGNANVCTGKQGLLDAREMALIAAKGLGIDENLVFVCSTGVIGAPLPMERIRPRIAEMAENIGRAGIEDAARAIMTTDTFPKTASKSLRIAGREVRIAGIAKGSGMIHPDMATMLSFIITDLAIGKGAIGKGLLQRALKASVEKSFNRVTVDGDTSTSDTVLIMANGLAGNPPLTGPGKDYAVFAQALDHVALELAAMVAADGEGATKLIRVLVKGAASKKDALRGAFAVANSPLVKTAFYGNDANWGRIMAALGKSGIAIEEEKVDIHLERLKLVNKGVSTGKDAPAADLLRKNKEIGLTIDLNLGPWSEKVLTCDLTGEYVAINAEYRT